MKETTTNSHIEITMGGISRQIRQNKSLMNNTIDIN